MPINVNDPEYVQAEKDYMNSRTLEEKIIYLKKMISHAPKHKGGENLRQQLTTRRKKLEQEIKKKKKSKKSTKQGIKKEDMQALIIGKTNSGKSSLLKALTNAEPKISANKFTTTQPLVAMMPYSNTQVQIIENPAIESEFFDKSLVHTTDTILILINNLKDLKEILNQLPSTKAKKIIVHNKSDFLNNEQKRKISATLQSNKYNYLLISAIPELPENNLKKLKQKIFNSFEILRIYTKEPGKDLNKAKQKPMILKPDSTIKDVAEKILKGFSKKVKESKIWGPSSKFSGQKIGLNHKLKDLDVVEFKTK